MPEENDRRDDEKLIASFARHAPAGPTRIDPLWIAYEAGRRDARRATRRWQGASGAVAVLAAVTLAWPREPKAIGPALVDPPLMAVITQQRLPTPPPNDLASVSVPPDNVIALRDAVLERGLDAMPRGPIESTPMPYGVMGMVDLQNRSIR